MFNFTSLVVLKTAVLVWRPLEPEILQPWFLVLVLKHWSRLFLRPIN